MFAVVEEQNCLVALEKKTRLDNVQRGGESELRELPENGKEKIAEVSKGPWREYPARWHQVSCMVFM